MEENNKQLLATPEDWVKFNTQLLDDSVQKSASYTNVIMTVAYTGFFILFTLIKDYSVVWNIHWHLNVKFIIGILIGLSVFLFVLWEIIKMFASQPIIKEYHNKLSELYKNNNLINKETFDKAIELQKQCTNKTNTLNLNLWPWFFGSSVITGFLAFILLIITYIQLISR